MGISDALIALGVVFIVCLVLLAVIGAATWSIVLVIKRTFGRNVDGRDDK